MKKLIRRLIRKHQAKKFGVPFQKKEWYNYAAMVGVEKGSEVGCIEIFDENRQYIDCPSIGGFVVYNFKGQRFKYKVVGFDNASRDSDWLYSTDYINPIIEFVSKIK